MKNFAGQRGFISITNILLFLVIVGVGYAGISFAGPYIRYNTLRSHTTDMLEMGTKVEDVKPQVLKEARELKIPLSEENVEVSVNSMKVIKVRATWSETVNFWDYYKKQLDFVMEVDS